MAKAIISSILESQLGKYVDGLKSDSLQVGLWSGELVLQDISLKPTAFAELNLPIRIVYGHIRRIHVVVPWNHLGSACVKVTLEGIHALVVPNTEPPSAEISEVAKANKLERMELIRQHDRLAKDKNLSGEDESTFLSRLTEKILDNLQVTLRDIHLRYEDTMSNPSAPFVAGIMMSTLSYQTTDAEGNQIFMDRSAATSENLYIHKELRLEQLSVYLDRPKQPLFYLEKNLKKLGKLMSDMIINSSDDTQKSHPNWLLLPCSLSVRLIKNESMDYSRVAKFIIQANVKGISLSVSQTQYEDILCFYQAISSRSAIEAYMSQLRKRPFYPVKRQPRMWWDYIVRLYFESYKRKKDKCARLTDMKRITQFRMRWSTIRWAGAERRAYIEAFRLLLRNNRVLENQTEKYKKHQDKTMKILFQFESEYPLDVVIALRNFAEDKEVERKKVMNEAEAARGVTKPGDASDGSWYNYFFGGTGATTTASSTANMQSGAKLKVSELLSEEGRKDLKQAYDAVVLKEKTEQNARDSNFTLFAVKLQMSAISFSLYHNRVSDALVSASLEGSLSYNLLVSNDFDLQFRLKKFEILNGLAKNTEFHSFCSLSSPAKPAIKPCVTVDIKKQIDESKDGEVIWCCQATAMPIRVMIDPEFALMLSDFFHTVEQDESEIQKILEFASSSVSGWIFSDNSEYNVKEIISETVEMIEKKNIRYDIAINMHAPIFVMAESIHEGNSNTIVIDCGDLIIGHAGGENGALAKSNRVEDLIWSVQLLNIQVLLGVLSNLSIELVFDNNNDAKNSWKACKFDNIVNEFGLKVDIKTRNSSLLSRYQKSSQSKVDFRDTAITMTPKIGIVASISSIEVNLNQQQVVSIGRIHSSFVSQLEKFTILQKQTAVIESELPAKTGNQTTRSKDSLQIISKDTGTQNSRSLHSLSTIKAMKVEPDRRNRSFLLKFSLFLQSITLKVKESTESADAFKLQIHQTSFDGDIFNDEYNVQAKLLSISLDDLLYTQESVFSKLISTGSNRSQEPTNSSELVYVKVNVIPSQFNSRTESVASTIVVDVICSALDIQWNPSSIALLYSIITNYVIALQSHNYANPSVGNNEPSNSLFQAQTENQDGNFSDIEDNVLEEEQYESNMPSVCIRASLERLSITFNKDEIQRQLIELVITTVNLEMCNSTYLVTSANSTDPDNTPCYVVKGTVENFIANDLSMTKHSVYSPLLGLNAISDGGSSNTDKAKQPLMKFMLENNQNISHNGGKSKISLGLQPVRLVYYHQQVLELVDYIFEGVLGAIVSRTLLSATQLLLQEEESDIVFEVSIDGSTVILPMSLDNPAQHIKLTTKTVELSHFPTTMIHYRKKSEAQEAGWKLDDFKKEIVTGASRSGNDQLQSVASYQADYKRATVRCLDIYSANSSNPKNISYDSLIKHSLDITIDIEDLVSNNRQLILSASTSDHILLPRFCITSRMDKEVLVKLNRSQYLTLVGLLQYNFGAEALNINEEYVKDLIPSVNADDSLSNNFTVRHTPSSRPTVVYTYNREDIEAATMQLNFVINSMCCELFDETADLFGVEQIVDKTMSSQDNMRGFAILKANSLIASLDQFRDSLPCFSVAIHNFNMLRTDNNCALISTQDKAQIVFIWDDEKKYRQVTVHASHVKGTILADTLLQVVELFAEPEESPAVVPVDQNKTNSPEILNNEFRLDLNVVANDVSLVLPQDINHVNGPNIAIAADFDVIYQLSPNGDICITNEIASAAADCRIQNHLVLNANNIEVVANHCNTGKEKFEAIQLIEPFDLNVEINDLTPYANQQQQMLAMKLSPIDVYLSYHDLCLIQNVITFISIGFTQHNAIKKDPYDTSAIKKSRAGSWDSTVVNGLDTRKYFTCTIKLMSLTIINDCDGCDMALAQLNVRGCNVFFNVSDSGSADLPAMSGGSNFSTIISYFDPEDRLWHPISEEWTLEISLQGGKNEHSAYESHIIISAAQTLDLCISHGLLEALASTYGAWNRRQLPTSDGKPTLIQHAPCLMRNDTGLNIRYWLSNSGHEHYDLANGEVASLPIKHLRKRGNGAARIYAQGDRLDTHIGKVTIQLLDTNFQPIYHIDFETLGSRSYPLIENSGSLSLCKINCDAKLIDGHILLSISSHVKVINTMSGDAVRLLVHDPTWETPKDVGILLPRAEMTIPVLLSVGTELRLRPIDENNYNWSAPIPIHQSSGTLSSSANVQLQVESPPNQSNAKYNNSNFNLKTIMYCVEMNVEESLRVICISEPIVIINKLPVDLSFNTRSRLGNRGKSLNATPETISVGKRAGICYTDVSQKPFLQLIVAGCLPSKWLDLSEYLSLKHSSNDVVELVVERNDQRYLKLALQVLQFPAKAIQVVIYAEIWFINRTGLELIYGNDSDSDLYVPPANARTLVGNAQICAYSSSVSSHSDIGASPEVRVCMGSCGWSPRFVVDPRRLSWQNECLQLRSERLWGPNIGSDFGKTAGTSVLYEFGVSADYSTRHFGNITTLVTIMPRYSIVNLSQYTLILLEESILKNANFQAGTNENAAHHILAKEEVYALYWVNGERSRILISTVAEDHNDGYGWSHAVSLEVMKTVDVIIPYRNRQPNDSRKSPTLQVNITQGNDTQSSIVITITEGAKENQNSIVLGSQISSQNAFENIGLHVQLAGITATLKSKKAKSLAQMSLSNQGASAIKLHKLVGNKLEDVARLHITRINMEFTKTKLVSKTALNITKFEIFDLMKGTKHPIVLQPIEHTLSTANRSGHRFLNDSSHCFFVLTYVEKPHEAYRWVEHVRLSIADVKIQTSMTFVNCLVIVLKDVSSHFQTRPLSLSSEAAWRHELDDEYLNDDDILDYFVTSPTGGSIAGEKFYIANGIVDRIKVVVSFVRDSSSTASGNRNQSFWMSHLKLKIDNASLTLDPYKLSHGLATQESLVDSLSNFYVKSVKSQALQLIESIQVTSLVTSMVTGGVSSLVSTLMGKTDPKLIGAEGHSFKYESLSNSQLIGKHAFAIDTCTSMGAFVQQVKHLVYDWDSNHTGLEARGCIALGIINLSRKPIKVRVKLNDGAEIRILPEGRSRLAGVGTSYHGSSRDEFQLGQNEWSSHRSLIVFAWGYTPTLLTSGSVYFTVQSIACDIYCTRKASRVKSNPGYTASFILEETTSWSSTNVVSIGDEIQTSVSVEKSPSISTQQSNLSSRGSQKSLQMGTEVEYTVEFTTASIGLIAQQADRTTVVVSECILLPSGAPSPAHKCGKIEAGDRIISVNGKKITTTKQFQSLVSGTPRPIQLTFRHGVSDEAYSLFGEDPPNSRKQKAASTHIKEESEKENEYNLFG